MSRWEKKPDVAFKKYIRPFFYMPKWVEDSKSISSKIKLNKRELFSLIVLAYTYGDNWVVGYSDDDSEPNDGYITNGERKIQVEHKVVPQMDKSDVLSSIIETYKKYAAQGKGYGQNRVLVIQPNKATLNGNVRISDLIKEIDGESPFDKVYTLVANSFKGHNNSNNNEMVVMHITEHYPREGESTIGKWMAQVNLDLKRGTAEVPHDGLS